MSDPAPTSPIPPTPPSPTDPSTRGHGAVESFERPGDTVGPYKLLEILGEGGFGVVWLAERREPMVQRVALKVIKPGMDSKAVLARFEQERQALAVMDHPHVARVFDAGATPQGRPYFVMEHVAGEPITDYCDRHNLTIRDRLKLFIPVCEAVQHAHHKGLIHRDLKPSNVLVAEIEGKPVPKVIDFGVAKAIASEGWTNTAHTQSGMVIGTPEYMSPEQVAGEIDVDTRADVYSLGVLLYELLTGELPFDSRELRKAALSEIQRIIREVTPPKPSTRLMQIAGDRTTTIAASRSVSRERLANELRRELDWIPLMALRKERERRYASPEALASDVQRYLDGEPLEAAPDSRAYLLRKFVRRNKGAVFAVGAVMLALLVGLSLATWQYQRANERAAAAMRAETEATAQATKANQQTAIAEAVAKFQTDMLTAADPDKLLGDKVTVLQAMQVAIKQLDQGSLADQPLVEAGVRDSIGWTLRSLARYEEAELNLRRSVALCRAALPAGHPTVAISLQNLAIVLSALNKVGEAETLYREAMSIYRVAYPSGHANFANTLNSLASLLHDQNKLAEAEALYREALAMHRATLRAGHPSIATDLNDLAMLLQDQGKLAEAEPLLREALEISRAAYPAAHPSIAAELNNLAMLMYAQSKLAEAEPLLRESLEIYRNAYPAGHPNTAASLINLSYILKAQNKLAEAEPMCVEALEIRRAVYSQGHPGIAEGLSCLADVLKAQNKLAEAEPLVRETVAINRKALPAGHPRIAASLHKLAVLLAAQNKLAEAEPLFREALETRRRVLGEEHPDTLESLSCVALLNLHQKNAREAPDLLTPFEPAARNAFTGGNARRLADFLTVFGRARVGVGYDPARFARAESNLLEAHPIFVAAPDRGPTHKDTLACVQGLIDLYTAWDAAEPGKGYDAKAAEWRGKLDADKPVEALAPGARPG